MNLSVPSRWLRGACAAALALCPLAATLRANDAALDPGFNTYETPDPDLAYSVKTIAVQPDGKVLLGGDFEDNFLRNDIGGYQDNLTRLLPDGHYDPAFKTFGTDRRVDALLLQPDGKVLVAGIFDRAGGLARTSLGRLNADGTDDAGFGPADSYKFYNTADSVAALALQRDGKILVGGDFGTYIGTTLVRAHVMRLNANGTYDPSFAPDVNAPIGGVRALVVQPDGKVLVGGAGDASPLTRFNADGTLDEGFTRAVRGSNVSTVYVASIVFQPDGKFIAGGRFVADAFSANERASLVRFNPDGTVDPTFNANVGPVNISAVALQADGKVLVGGSDLVFNGVAVPGLARLNADGSLDTSFETGLGATFSQDGYTKGAVRALAIQADGKPLIGGEFKYYSGVARTLVARLGGGSVVEPPPPTNDKLPDLGGTLADVRFKLNANGTKVKASGTLNVRNAGRKPAKNVGVAVYLSDDQNFSVTADRLVDTLALADYGIKKLGKNQETGPLKAKFKVRTEDLGPTTGKYLLVVLDPQGSIEEADETNNVIVYGPLP